MIGSLRGRLLHRRADELLVEVAGVGYRCTVTPATAVGAGDVGEEVFVHVHHHVREDASILYAFVSLEERICFEALIGAHGVGPALALAILSVHTPMALRHALADDDVAALCLVPGVGKKTALRLLVELKSRLDLAEVDLTAVSGAANGNANANGNGHAFATSARGEVREALAGLGYGPEEIREALAALPDDGTDDDASSLLRLALRSLAGAPR